MSMLSPPLVYTKEESLEEHLRKTLDEIVHKTIDEVIKLLQSVGLQANADKDEFINRYQKRITEEALREVAEVLRSVRIETVRDLKEADFSYQTHGPGSSKSPPQSLYERMLTEIKQGTVNKFIERDVHASLRTGKTRLEDGDDDDL